MKDIFYEFYLYETMANDRIKKFWNFTFLGAKIDKETTEMS